MSVWSTEYTARILAIFHRQSIVFSYSTNDKADSSKYD
jgi:hypothetical protein